MPEALHLPPLASAIITITGVILAIVRLLTASRPVWDVLPNWLQKAAPAALVALGVIPPAIEHATSWVQVAEAVVLAIGAFYTASRGDKRPPIDKDGGPRVDRVNSDPKLTREELEEKTPPSLPSAFKLASFVAIGWMVGCSGAQPAPPCDPETIVAMTAECSAAAYQCGKEGVPEAECAPMIKCDERLDSRQARCSQ